MSETVEGINSGSFENGSGLGSGGGNKYPQNVPDWVKITEIPHPALVPGFISRRECLPDGSLDPNTPSVTSQMVLLQASNLSPSLSAVISNVPSGLICESIHKKNLKDGKDEVDGFVLTHAPSHYQRTSESNTSNSAINAHQTTSELAAINILYGGVRGKAYLDSLKSFVDAAKVTEGSKIEALLKEKIEKSESVCGFKIFSFNEESSENIVDLDTKLSDFSSLIDQNHELCRLLNAKNLEEAQRAQLLAKLKHNLDELMRECPEDVKKEKFKGVSFI